MITINSVYKYSEGEKIRISDIIDEYGYIINIDANTSMPKKELLRTIEEEIKANNLILIKDPFARCWFVKSLIKTLQNQ